MNLSQKKPLIVLTGPTAVGKTKLSIALAKAIGGEIISADSMQVYKQMDIGTAKITKEEMQGVNHYLIDEFSPEDDFNVVKFKEYALKYMDEIYARGNIPIIVGGTGFYIQALLYDIQFDKTEDDNHVYREELEEIAIKQGSGVLYNMLKEIDPKSAEAIHENNTKRVIRAIEFFRQNGYPISEHNEEQRQNESPYNYAYFVLNHERSILYQRIDQRVDLMVEQGLEKEVQVLYDEGYDLSLVSMQGLGYKEIISYFEGEISLEEAIYRIKRDTRHFAKRQITWFKREKDVIWVNKQEFDEDEAKILDFMLGTLREKQMIANNQ